MGASRQLAEQFAVGGPDRWGPLGVEGDQRLEQPQQLVVVLKSLIPVAGSQGAVTAQEGEPSCFQQQFLGAAPGLGHRQELALQPQAFGLGKRQPPQLLQGQPDPSQLGLFGRE